jgi:hypothetical protein
METKIREKSLQWNKRHNRYDRFAAAAHGQHSLLPRQRLLLL